MDMVKIVGSVILKSMFAHGRADGTFDLDATAQDVITAMREPTEAMCHAGYYDATHSIESVGSLCDLTPEDQPRSIWQAMIDEALKSAKPSAKP